MKNKDSLLISLRDCALGWVASVPAFYFAASWEAPGHEFLEKLPMISLLIAVVIMIIAFPISVFFRRHLPSDRPNLNSAILGMTGIVLSQLIVILLTTIPFALFTGEFTIDLKGIYQAPMTPFFWGAAVAGGVIGHMAGVPGKPQGCQISFGYGPEKRRS